MSDLFNLKDRVIIATGATGTLVGSAVTYLAAQGARIACIGRNQARLDATLARLHAASPNAQCLGLSADVLDRPALESARDQILSTWGRIDALLNGAGGNLPEATIPPDKSFTDLNLDGFRKVIDLNLHGAVLPTLVFAPAMITSGRGSIVNYSSASVPQAITRVVGYSAAKAALENFTRWLAVELARRSNGEGGKVRVNALLPGFFIGDQNRRLLTNTDGSLTDRGKLIIQNTPFGRFGEPHELHGALHYLLSDASQFVTGSVLPVDGGFTIFSGV
ncbi:MAG TPA: SDR family oxidoreductase [Phycisphaerae bacterium]|nr:SDR family oxidoreductase [Phycisphaerae bacterium]